MHQELSANADALGAPRMRRLAERAASRELPGQLMRGYPAPAPAQRAASRQIAALMQAAGTSRRTAAGPGLV